MERLVREHAKLVVLPFGILNRGRVGALGPLTDELTGQQRTAQDHQL